MTQRPAVATVPPMNALLSPRAACSIGGGTGFRGLTARGLRSGLLVRTPLAILATGTIVAVAAYAMVFAALGFAAHGTWPLLAVFVAAAASAVAGFAFSALCGALLFHLIDAPVAIVQILLLCSIANQVLAVVSMGRDIVWRRVMPFLAAGALGVPVGVLALLHASPQGYLTVFGVALIAYSLYLLLRPASPSIVASGAGDWVMGFLGGLTGGVAAFPGAVVTIWAGYRGWNKREQRAVYQPFILAMQCLALAMLALMQPPVAGFGLDPAVLAYVPVSLLGTWYGLSVFRRLTDRQFDTVTRLLLIAAGMAMRG